jgi:hypothetical protein
MVAGNNLSPYSSWTLIISFILVYLKTLVVTRALWRPLLVFVGQTGRQICVKYKAFCKKKKKKKKPFPSGAGVGI